MDRSLVELAQGGDRDAFAGLVRAVGDRLYGLAFRILRDPDRAQDAYQEAMIAVWRQLPSLRDPDRFDAWARQILVHECYAESKRRSRWVLGGSVDDAFGGPEGVGGRAGADEGAAVDDRDALDRAFARLSLEHRAVFVLHHHQGLSLVEVAETLRIPQGTARSRLHYATRALRETLGAADMVTVGEGAA